MLNMAALMVSLIAILPSVRESMGRSSQITLAEVCIIAQTATIILTFIHMIKNVDEDLGKVQSLTPRNYYYMGKEGLGIACVVITALVSFVLFVFLMLHVLIWRKTYHHFDEKRTRLMEFNRKLWGNRLCDL